MKITDTGVRIKSAPISYDFLADLKGKREISGHRLSGKPDEMKGIIAGVKRRAPYASFNSDNRFAPCGAEVLDTTGGYGTYHVIELDSTPEMWVRRRDSGDGHYLMIRPADKSRVC